MAIRRSRDEEKKKRKQSALGTDEDRVGVKKRQEKILTEAKKEIGLMGSGKSFRRVAEHLAQTTPKARTPSEQVIQDIKEAKAEKAPTVAAKEKIERDFIPAEPEGEKVELRVVGREEAFRVAAEAGGVPPDTPITIDGRPVKGGDIARQLIPFNKERIGIHTDNRIFNTAAEYVLNNPYATAISLAGLGIGISAIKAGLAAKGVATAAKVRTGFRIGGTVGTVGTSAKIATNTVVAKSSVTMASKIAAFMKKPSFFVPAVLGIIGTYPWGEWALGEAKESMAFNVSRVQKLNDPALIAEFLEQGHEIYDMTAWENFIRLTPANIAFGFTKKAKALNSTWDLSIVPTLEKRLEELAGEDTNDRRRN